MKKVLLVCPVHNEAKILESKVEEILSWSKINLRKYNWQLAIVDNASTDATRLGHQLEKKYENFKYLRINEKGRVYALMWAWQKQKFDYSIYMDIDLSTDLKHIQEVLQELEIGYDLVVGSRWMKSSIVKNRNIQRTILSFGYKTLVQLLTHSRISDFQCGFKGIRKNFVEKNMHQIEDKEWFFDTELILNCQRNNYKIRDIPVIWKNDPDSRVSIIKDCRKMLFSLVRWLIVN
jgi:hypothetical protein